MTILAAIGIFTAGSSFGLLLAVCVRGFARHSGEYDRVFNEGASQ
jgi:hypothetical protein